MFPIQKKEKANGTKAKNRSSFDDIQKGALEKSNQKPASQKRTVYVLQTEWNRLTKSALPLINGIITDRASSIGGGSWQVKDKYVVAPLLKGKFGWSIDLPPDEGEKILEAFLTKYPKLSRATANYLVLCRNSTTTDEPRAQKYKDALKFVGSFSSKGQEKEGIKIYDLKETH